MQTQHNSDGAVTGQPVVEHLADALDSADKQTANFHIRQAMQLLIAKEE